MSVERHNPVIFLPPTEKEIFGDRKFSDIDVGMLQLQILWILNDRPMHGYELMKELNKVKKTKIAQGTLYPTLQKLEEYSLVRRETDARRIVYSTTARGKRAVNEACWDFCRTFFGIFHDFVCERCVERPGLKK
ncbi:MAG: PadR family transcriptional regulator [Candidatus Aenigmarchaeota archaeon]|nr:PadR family transcriptional regulator [Candidatus Aenigmarchaeota archaeon]